MVAGLLLMGAGFGWLGLVIKADVSYPSRTSFMHGIRFAILVAAAAALAAMIPALLAPSKAQAPASAGESNPVLAQPQ